jgi:CheY-like chemotaxis protein
MIPKETNQAGGGGEGASHVAARILLVDDDPRILKVLSRLLRSKGYEVETCEAPGPALGKLQAAAYDLLVTDQVMGGMRGLELARRALEHRAGLRCFVISGHHAPSPDECAHVTWINKPIDVAPFLAAIQAALQS